ncbi:hypothetical protein HPB47_011608 [Ixodes persulcatus]|uniref:Uncharacterized protein n=1 Tax=Ixodes persulcatus TaxID=34615 RepID=A0AC60NW55_IXOPE|nr:hypothetical protein HPB47_011608 [Ixodes persulcatus]
MTSLLWNAQTAEVRAAAAPARQLCSRLGGSEARALAYGSPWGGFEFRPRRLAGPDLTLARCRGTLQPPSHPILDRTGRNEPSLSHPTITTPEHSKFDCSRRYITEELIIASKPCNLISSGVAAIFGPNDPMIGAHIQSLSDSLDIPHIESRLDLEPDAKDCSVNLHPDPHITGKSMRDLVDYLNWTRIAVLYQDDISLISLQELVRPFPPKNVQYLFRRAENFTATLMDIKSRGIYSMIIDVRPENLTAFLRAILQIQMNDYKYHYHFATYDIEAYNLEDFQYNFVNITAYRMVDSDNQTVRHIMKDMEKFQPFGQNILNRTNVIITEPALMFDAVYAFAHGLNDLQRSTTLRPANVSCEDEVSWTEGTSLFNLISMSRPYVMMKDNKNLTGNDRFDGFCIDLLRTIADLLGFNYELYLVPDKKFGVENTSTGEWNGMVREIIDKNADLAVAPMTINYARESVIDFTKPFMNLGIGILFMLPSGMPVKLFSFMSPLDVDIWLYVLAAYILVSFTMFIVARFSPYEWRNPHPCVRETGVMENQFSLGNSFWFTIVTLMHQGCDLNPKAMSTRIVGTIWWFFTLILISSYTANLAAFLTVERMITPIESVEDLAEQSKIAYGTLDSGSTMTFFRVGALPIFFVFYTYPILHEHP